MHMTFDKEFLHFEQKSTVMLAGTYEMKFLRYKHCSNVKCRKADAKCRNQH